MIDIGALFSSSWNKFSKNIGMAIVVYLVGSIVAGILSALTLGIVGIPVFAGIYKSMRKAQRGEVPDFNDLFSEFSNFGQWFMFWVVMLVVGIAMWILYFVLMLTVVGIILLPFIGIAVGMLLFFVIPLMLERRMAAFEAVKESISKVTGSLGKLALPTFLVLLVSGVFAIITGPWMAIAMWDVYDQVYGGNA